MEVMLAVVYVISQKCPKSFTLRWLSAVTESNPQVTNHQRRVAMNYDFSVNLRFRGLCLREL